MWKKLDALFRRKKCKASQSKCLLNLALNRLAILKNQRRARFSQARKDVLELLRMGKHDNALIRVEYVINDLNLLDAYELIEGFCQLLLVRTSNMENGDEGTSKRKVYTPFLCSSPLRTIAISTGHGIKLKQASNKDKRTCAEELKDESEAISSLIFASSRCEELNELQELRSLFRSMFGNGFVESALHGDSGVNIKLMQKMSTELPASKAKLEMLKKIAAEGRIQLNMEDQQSYSAVGSIELNQERAGSLNAVSKGETSSIEKETWMKKEISMKETSTVPDNLAEIQRRQVTDDCQSTEKYSNSVEAAQAAFEWAAYAAATAQAAIALSRNSDESINLSNAAWVEESSKVNAQKSVQSEPNFGRMTVLQTSSSASSSYSSSDDYGDQSCQPRCSERNYKDGGSNDFVSTQASGVHIQKEQVTRDGEHFKARSSLQKHDPILPFDDLQDVKKNKQKQATKRDRSPIAKASIPVLKPECPL